MLDEGAAVGQLGDVLEGGVDGVGRVLDQPALDAALLGLLEQGPDLRDVEEVAGRQNRVELGDLVEDVLDLVLDPPSSSTTVSILAGRIG